MIMFDDAIDTALAVLYKRFPDALPSTHILREVFGAVTVVIPDDLLSQAHRADLAHDLDAKLAQYSPGIHKVLSEERDLIDPVGIFESPDKVPLFGHPGVFLVDDMLTNQDWLRPPLSGKSSIPTLVALSLRGGVGRSTALAMLAWHLARSGKRVLVIDLDLEEPGIGPMLASELPAFGLADWLTECLNGPVDNTLLARCIASSPIGREMGGGIEVIPAYGSQTRNYISKLGRIYIPTMNDDYQQIGLADRLIDLLHLIQERPARPDVILMDAHAGFHDIGAAAITHLGAEALLFGRNDPASWWAYRALFEHLRVASSISKGIEDDGDLRRRVKMVSAPCDRSAHVRQDWINASYETWKRFYNSKLSEPQHGAALDMFDRTDRDAPHYPLFIGFDSAVRSMSLIDPSAKPEWSVVQDVFGDFFSGVEKRLWPTANSKENTVQRPS
jgi:hypothetical protein